MLFRSGIDVSLLAWALSSVVEEVRHHLGSVMTVVTLRRIHHRQSRERPTLNVFRVLDDGRVAVAASDAEGAGGAPASVVNDVAGWLAAFLDVAESVGGTAQALPLRQVTKMMESELEAIDFYDAVAAVHADIKARSSAS